MVCKKDKKENITTIVGKPKPYAKIEWVYGSAGTIIGLSDDGVVYQPLIRYSYPRKLYVAIGIIVGFMVGLILLSFMFSWYGIE